jgi:hypothetical protein
VVTLDSGTTVRRALIGLDPSTYQGLRRAQFVDAQLLRVRAGRLQAMGRDSLLAAQTAAVQAEELRRCRAGLAARDADFDQLAAAARQAAARPVARPVLLDPHTYQGAAAGAVLLLALRLLLHP